MIDPDGSPVLSELAAAGAAASLHSTGLRAVGPGHPVGLAHPGIGDTAVVA